MSKIKYRSALALLIISLIVLLAFSIVVKAEGDLITLLHEKLISLGVPVEEIIITQRLPLQIEIILQSDDDIHMSEEVIRYKQLTFHEALLAHRFGLKVAATTVVIQNSKGDVLDWEQIYVNDKSPSRQPSFEGPILDQGKVEEIFMRKLQLGDMKLKKLNIQKGAGTNQESRTITIELVAPNLEVANYSIPNFMGSLHYTIRKANQEGARLSICRVLITDGSGKILLDYIYDVEIGRQSWKMSDGLTNDWFPHPDEKKDATPAATSTPWTPSPPFNSPLPTPRP